MKKGSRLTIRSFVTCNAIIAALFLNTLLFGPLLKAGESFTAGLATGIGVGWLILLVTGILELQRPGRTMDERQLAFFTKAASVGFCMVLLAASVLQILARSKGLDLSLDAKDAAAIISDLGLAGFAISWAVLAKKG